ncbi:MAG: NEW3 domain-containing protein [Archaeoglobaceae archaeon]|nr:NEW3 domain-containing protein [Archaeoglobaceae archaeon]MDW7989972.1 NEW3 domain-containing protein [Archaeoglobaceae archaeon]
MRIILFFIIIIISLTPVLALECEIKEINAVPGEEITISLQIKNTDSDEKTYTLSYYGDLEGYFYYENKRISSIKLTPNKTATLSFTFTAPEKVGIYYISLQADESVGITLNVSYPEKSVEVIPKIKKVVLEAGDTVNIEVTLKNKLNARYELNLSCEVPTQWECRFYDGNHEVKKLTLSAGESRTIKALIETESSSTVGNYSAKLKFNEKVEEIEVLINKTHVGEKGEIRLKLVDKDGKGVASAKVTVGEEIFYTSGDGEAIIEVLPGTYDLKIEKGGYEVKTIRDVKVKGGRTNDLETVLLEKKAYYAEITISSRVSATIGEVTSIPVKIKNSGYADDSYALRVEGLPSDDYTATFKQDNLVISEIFIESGDTEELKLELYVPSTAEPKEIPIKIVAEGAYTTVKNLTLKILGTFKLYFEPENGKYTITTSQGESVELKGEIKNSGVGTTLTNIRISVTLPNSDWELEDISPELISSLKPGERYPVSIKINIPADASPSEYKVTIDVKADQTETTDRITFVVQEKGYGTLIGISLIVASLIAIYFLIKKFGRR